MGLSGYEHETLNKEKSTGEIYKNKPKDRCDVIYVGNPMVNNSPFAYQMRK